MCPIGEQVNSLLEVVITVVSPVCGMLNVQINGLKRSFKTASRGLFADPPSQSRTFLGDRVNNRAADLDLQLTTGARARSDVV